MHSGAGNRERLLGGRLFQKGNDQLAIRVRPADGGCVAQLRERYTAYLNFRGNVDGVLKPRWWNAGQARCKRCEGLRAGDAPVDRLLSAWKRVGRSDDNGVTSRFTGNTNEGCVGDVGVAPGGDELFPRRTSGADRLAGMESRCERNGHPVAKDMAGSERH